MSQLVRLLQRKLAEGVGFEPTVGLTQRSISRGAFACNSQAVTKALPMIANIGVFSMSRFDTSFAHAWRRSPESGKDG